jgi:hypothetical protein
MTSTVIPQPQRSEAGKILGNFYALTRDELLAWKKAGMFKGAAYLGLCLRCDNPFLDKPIKISVEKFCDRWQMGMSQYFKSLRQLKEIGFLRVCKTESFIYLNSVDLGSDCPNVESTSQTDSATVQTDSVTSQTNSVTVQTDSATSQTNNFESLESLPGQDSSDYDLQTLKDLNKDIDHTFTDREEVEKYGSINFDVITDHWGKEDPAPEPLEVEFEPLVNQENSSSGSNVPPPPADENFSNLSTELVEEPKYTKNTQRAIALFEQKGIVPKGLDLAQWASEAIGPDLQLYRKSGRLQSFHPKDIDEKFLKFLEVRLTQNKAGKTANPTGWVNSMERDPSRWGELVDMVQAWQRAEFLETEEGMAAKRDYNNATLDPYTAEIVNKFSEYF